MMLMVGTQILWSAYAIVYDHSKAYSPDLAAAQFLKPLVRQGASIAVTYLEDPRGNGAYDAVGISPYFDHNIYMNQPDFFWSWSDTNPTDSLFTEALLLRPQVVLLEIRQASPAPSIDLKVPRIKGLINAGYRLTNVFCGTKPERLELGETNCHLVFQSRVLPRP
jgi:hypothetical protein